MQAVGRIIAIANQKGGVGKTTTSVNLSACLAHIGKKVLLIDTDPQGNATSGVGVNKGDVQNCIYDILIDDVDVNEVILTTKVENLGYYTSYDFISWCRNRTRFYNFKRS